GAPVVEMQWDLSGSELPGGGNSAVFVSPAGDRVAGVLNGVIDVWDVETGALWATVDTARLGSDVIAGPQERAGSVRQVLFRADGSFLVVIASASDAKARPAFLLGEHGAPLAELTGHAQPIVHASISGDGRRIVTVSEDGTARVYADDGKQTGELR